jgi:hypothetical protein
MFRKYVAVFVVSIFGCGAIPVLSQAGTHDSLSPDIRYCLGLFSPVKDPRFVSLSSVGVPTRDKGLLLRSEAASALKRMIDSFRSEHPQVKVWVQSATRNFDAQKGIWNKKWRSSQFSKFTDPVSRARAILAFSSMPGTSRHHWGSDVDLNVLENGYYDHGEGKILLEWLEKNASRFGFARPYTAGRKSGYNEERWHWSYLPVAHECFAVWLKFYDANPSFFTRKDLFEGSTVAGHWVRDYVTSINPECQ